MKIPVSAPQNIWFDAQNVDDDNLNLEQNYNNQIQNSIINNHFGSGILTDSLIENILFDSSLVSGLLDTQAIDVQFQPTDTNLGNQLLVELSNSLAAGKRNVKFLIIGLDFENNLQYDAFVFKTNEMQITSKHYTKILKVFFNDFIGDPVQSFNLGGKITIKEVRPLSLSRDTIMVAQDVEPNLFFRDFFVSGTMTINTFLQNALPSYNINALNIKTGFKQLRSIAENDVSSQIGQKFIAITNNIQKITLLMSVINNIDTSDLAWTGDIVISVYPLQSSVNCITDIVPSSAINFDPNNIPLAQLTFNYDSMAATGIILNTVPQPVDFIFSNTSIANGSIIIPNSFYAVTLKRSGSPDKCQIQLAVGNDDIPNSQETLFNGSVWLNVPEEDLWFQIWTDAAKISDGQGYDEGHGFQVTKTVLDSTSGITIDNSLGEIQFTRNDTFYAIAQAVEQDSVPVQDERTGNPILSEKQFVPQVSLLNSASLLQLQKTSDPLVLGAIKDENVKSFNSGTANIPASIHEFAFTENNCLIKIIDDPSDGYRYDLNVINLVSELISGSLVNSKFIPNTNNSSVFYRVAKAELLTMKVGDVNGDGIVDESDLTLAEEFLGYNLNIGPTHSEYLSLINLFKNESTLNYQIIDPNTMTIITSGSDGVIAVNAFDGTIATFTSTSATFNTIIDIGSLQLVVFSATNSGNNGTFTITGLIDNHNIAIKKIFYNSDAILQAFRADINGDMIVDDTDILLLENYINKVAPFPATTSPGNKVGTTFNVIKLTLEEFTDRADEYPNINTNRNTTVHPLPDIFLDGYTVFSANDFLHNPIPCQFTQQLNWEDFMVSAISTGRQVSSSFIYDIGGSNETIALGIQDETLPIPPEVDPGRNDIFIPNNLVMNFGSQLTTPDGYYYKVDFETAVFTLEIPTISFISEKSINIFTDLVANFNTNGTTRLGYQAMKFADGSYVGLDALAKNQLSFSVSLQSFSPELDEIDGYDLTGIVVDGKVGVFMNYETGLLTLNFSNLYEDPVLQTLNTKVQIVVFAKKAGFNNGLLTISSTILQNILEL